MAAMFRCLRFCERVILRTATFKSPVILCVHGVITKLHAWPRDDDISLVFSDFYEIF